MCEEELPWLLVGMMEGMGQTSTICLTVLCFISGCISYSFHPRPTLLIQMDLRSGPDQTEHPELWVWMTVHWHVFNNPDEQPTCTTRHYRQDAILDNLKTPRGPQHLEGADDLNIGLLWSLHFELWIFSSLLTVTSLNFHLNTPEEQNTKPVSPNQKVLSP